MQRKLDQGMKITPLGHLDKRMEPRPIQNGRTSIPGLTAISRSQRATLRKATHLPLQREEQACPCPGPQGLSGGPALSSISPVLFPLNLIQSPATAVMNLLLTPSLELSSP